MQNNIIIFYFLKGLIDMDILKDFGKIVAEKRKAIGISQEELAHKAELHRTYIGMVERGEKNITIKSIFKLSSALDCSIEELVKGL